MSYWPEIAQDIILSRPDFWSKLGLQEAATDFWSGVKGGEGSGWFAPPKGTHGPGSQGGEGVAGLGQSIHPVPDTVYKSRWDSWRQEIHDEVEKTWEGKRRDVGALALEETFADNTVVFRDKGEVIAVASIKTLDTNNPTTIPEYWKGLVSQVPPGQYMLVKWLATKRSGYGTRAMMQLFQKAYLSGQGMIGSSLPHAFGFYEQLGAKRIPLSGGRESGLALYWPPPDVGKLPAGFPGTKAKGDDLEPEDGVFFITPREWDIGEKGGEGSGWFGPPKGTHGPGSQGGTPGPISGPADQTEYFTRRDGVEMVGDKYPHEVTWKEFMDYHYTGTIPDEHYDTDTMFQGIFDTAGNLVVGPDTVESHPILLEQLTLNDGRVIDLRQSGEKLQYAATDSSGEILRDDQGLALYMPDHEVIARGLPLYSDSIEAFHGDRPVGTFSNEWGATGIWVDPEYQGQGLGLALLTRARQYPWMAKRPLGQMTTSGFRLSSAYYRYLVEQAIARGEDVHPEALSSIPDWSQRPWQLAPWELAELEAEKGGPGSGWFGPPKGDHGPSSQTPGKWRSAPLAQRGIKFLEGKTGAVINRKDRQSDSTLGLKADYIFDNGVTVQTWVREEEDRIFLMSLAAKKTEDMTEVAVGTGRGTQIVEGLRDYADATGKKLYVPDATRAAVPYWDRIPFLSPDRVRIGWGELGVPYDPHAEYDEYYWPPNTYSYTPEGWEGTKGGPNSGWYGPPRGTHGPGSQSGLGHKVPKTESEKELHQFLDLQTKILGQEKREGWKYNTQAELMLAQGKFTTPNPLPEGYERGQPNLCFMNASQLAWTDPDLTYVEGYAIPSGVGLPIPHAWVVDSEGRLIDNTWKEPGDAYFGIHMDGEWAFTQMVGRSDTPVYGLFDGMYSRDPEGWNPVRDGVAEEGLKGGPGSGWYAPPKGTHGPGSQGGAPPVVTEGELPPLPAFRPTIDDDWNAERRLIQGREGLPPGQADADMDEDRHFYATLEFLEPEDVFMEQEVDYQVEETDRYINDQYPWLNAVTLEIYYENPMTDERVDVETIYLKREDAERWDKLHPAHEEPDQIDMLSDLMEYGYVPDGEYSTTVDVYTTLSELGGWSEAPEEIRAQVKDRIVTEISGRIGADYHRVNDVLADWASSSSKSINSVHLQRMAAQEFGTELEPWIDGQWRELVNQGSKPSLSDEEARDFLRVSYEMTQDRLSSVGYHQDGTDYILLYRGFSLPNSTVDEDLGSISERDIITMVQNPIASWSASSGEARPFANPSYDETGILVQMAVPIEHVVSSSVTGLGCLTEGEFIVLGLPGQAEVIWTYRK